LTVPDKESERELLDHFLKARQRATGRSLTFDDVAERPDFICVRRNRVRVGVEVTKVTFGPDGRLGLDPVDEVIRLIEKKEASRALDGWLFADRSILVLGCPHDSIADLAPDLLLRPNLPQHGFLEIWLADFTQEEAFGNVELFGLYPAKWGRR